MMEGESMKTLFRIVLPIAFASVMAAQTTPTTRPPIIDMHMHTAERVQLGSDGRPLPLGCRPLPCESRPSTLSADTDVLEATLETMKKFNIVKGFLSGRPLELLDKWVNAAPDRFFPSIWWTRDFPDVNELREGYRAGRLKGMGEIGTQYAGIAANDPRIEPYFALAEEFDVPVLIHLGGGGAPNPTLRISIGRPLLLEEVLVRHPKLRISIENAGHPFFEEIVALMGQYPQVYADVSTITWLRPRSSFHRYLRNLMEAGLGKRIMFGSDAVDQLDAIPLAIEAIESADFFTAEQKRDIFYNNAARFLRLD